MLKAFKYRIYPTPKQAELINKTIGVCRLVYNLALETKIRAWQSANVTLSAYDLQHQVVELKQAYDWMKEVDSQAINAAIKNMDSAYKGFFRGKGFPRFKRRKLGGSFQCPGNLRKVDWEKQTLSVPKISNIPIKLSRKFDGIIRVVTIQHTSTGKYYASILAKTQCKEPKKPMIEANNCIGVDIGIKSFAVTSDGRSFESNQYLKKNLERLKVLQRRASRKKSGSKNKKKAFERLGLLYEKISNQRADYIHKITTGLIRDNQAGTFVIEDLYVAGMLKNEKLSRSISDASFGEFFRQMKYKSEWYGKNLIVIDRFAPSSKRCSDCGKINKNLTLADREWTCECGAHHDRDHNAAKNIKYYGLLKHSGEGIPSGPVESFALAKIRKQENSDVVVNPKKEWVETELVKEKIK